MNDLPGELVAVILSKLPVNSLLLSRAVSKIWLEIIDDLSFRKTYESKSCMILGLCCRDRNDSTTVFCTMTSDRVSVVAKEMITAEEIRYCHLGNCCNGLFYFNKYHMIGQPRRLVRELLVFNPFMKETLKLPDAPKWSPYGHNEFVLGFDPSTGTFKLLDLFFEDADRKKVRAATFNFKTQSWGICKASRHLSHPVRSLILLKHATDTGNVYLWTGKNCMYNSEVGSLMQMPDRPLGQVILSFDMAKEEFQSAWFPKRVHSMHITEIDGKLAVCTSGVKYINIDVLVDYKTQKWIRRFQILKPPLRILVDFCALSEKKIIVAYLPEESVISTKQFYLLDLGTGEWTGLGKGRFTRRNKLFSVRPNLVSLK
ncbi:hypothetical protein MLD38_014226 [Melastoma candidum]|nr:hypothetical protein MLD38_014226 [Melastoma candidum]